jgi:multidrug resistance protein, MATE family
MADVPAYAAGWGLLFHIPFNLFFIHTVGLGYMGAAVATVCCYMIQVIFVITYLFILPHGRHRVLDATGAFAIDRTTLSFWNEFRIAAFSIKGIVQYLTLALPGIVIISEWWASEIAIFLSGQLEPFPESALGGMYLCVYVHLLFKCMVV